MAERRGGTLDEADVGGQRAEEEVLGFKASSGLSWGLFGILWESSGIGREIASERSEVTAETTSLSPMPFTLAPRPSPHDLTFFTLSYAWVFPLSERDLLGEFNLTV